MFRFTVRALRLTMAVPALCVLAAAGDVVGQDFLSGRATQVPAPVIAGQSYRRPPESRHSPPPRAPQTARHTVADGIVPALMTEEDTLPPAGSLSHSAEPLPLPAEEFPGGWTPWWQAFVSDPLRGEDEPYSIHLDALIVSALAHSPRVRAVSQDVLIQETAVLEARAAFDPYVFMDSKFFRRSEPIGNVLETGGPPRLREGDFGYAAGLRKRTPLGGSWEMSQRIGMRDSNSRFFTPEQQGNSRLSLSFSQPLLNGFGKPYNNALIMLADIDTTVAMDQTSASLQTHLLQVVDAYWELYLQRSILLQKRRHLRRAEEILDRLANRREVDALESQILRARAAVASRQAELARANANIRNVEALLRALTNAPELQAVRTAELVPLDQPLCMPLEVRQDDAMVTALQHRPEIDAAAQEIRAAGVRLAMSRNELLPALDLVLETYVSGLDRDYDISQAVVDQFSVGEPSYSAGLVFEVPLDRRAAKARYQRRQLQLRQITQQFEETAQMLMAEVEVAVREVDATRQELIGKCRAVLAADAEVAYLSQRWELLSGDDRSVSFLLEDLLDAQDRLASEEYGFAVAQRDCTISHTALKRATGTLLQQQQIVPVRSCQGGLPEVQFERTGYPVSPH